MLSLLGWKLTCDAFPVSFLSLPPSFHFPPDIPRYPFAPVCAATHNFTLLAQSSGEKAIFMASLPPHHILLAQEAAGRLPGAGGKAAAAAGGMVSGVPPVGLLPPSVSAGPSASEGMGEIRASGEGNRAVEAGGGGGGHVGVTIDQWEEEEEGAGERELLWVQLVGFPCVELSEMKEQFVASVKEIHR